MKIRMYYESKLDKDTIILDVPDEECEIMVERDYQQRVAEAAPENRAAVSSSRKRGVWNGSVPMQISGLSRS